MNTVDGFRHFWFSLRGRRNSSTVKVKDLLDDMDTEDYPNVKASPPGPAGRTALAVVVAGGSAGAVYAVLIARHWPKPIAAATAFVLAFMAFYLMVDNIMETSVYE